MLKTPVSILQELMVHKKLNLPDYETNGTGQPHTQTFTCNVNAGGQTATGTGPTKKDAKQDAAKNMLKVFGVNLAKEQEVSNICLLPTKSSKVLPGVNYVGKINEFASGHRYSQPVYSDQMTVQNSQFCISCSFANFKTEGYGLNKKDAKQDAAKQMLAVIKENNLGIIPSDKCVSNEVEYNNNIADTEDILNRYYEQIQNLNINDIKTKDIMTNIRKGVEVSNWNELTALLDQLGYTYELKTFQDNPLILSLKINESILLNHGDTKQEALDKLIFQAALMIKDDVKFKKGL